MLFQFYFYLFLYKNHFELLQKKFLKKKSFLITLCTCGLRGYQKNIKIIINFTIKLFFIVINVSNNVITKFIIIIIIIFFF